jgi:GntR family transcriptional regulator
MAAFSLKPGHRTLTSATADVLRDAIQNKQFPAGSQLPPELELIETLGVSRATLREALRVLEEQGFIVRKRGLGTYVREQSIIKDLSINFGISEMITQAGLAPGARETIIRRDKASGTIAAELHLDEGDDLVRIERVRTANDRPVVWSADIVAEKLLAGKEITEDILMHRSVYAFLSEQLDINIIHGVARLVATTATSEMARRLAILKGSPLMLLTQTDFDGDDRPVLYSIEYHLPDSFVFLVNRKGPHW